MYSLVNAPTVGYDLARTPTGAAVATVLLEALAVQPGTGVTRDLSAFDASGIADPRRATAWLAVSALAPAPRLDETLSAVRQVFEDAVRGLRDPESGLEPGAAFQPAMTGLVGSYFGGLEDLLHLVQIDILDESPSHVVTLASDALAAAYAGRRLPDDERHCLGAPWITATRSLPPIPADLGPFTEAVRRVLDRLPLLTLAQAEALIAAAKTAETDWSRRMHEAAWAAYLSGRLRPTAAAQFQAVRGLRASGLTADIAARGVWNVVSGCLQAVGLHDLLDEVTFGLLVAPWETVMGLLT